MKYSFSQHFKQPLYKSLLHDMGRELEDYRILSGSWVKEMMTDLHISHRMLKSVFNGEDVSPLYYVAVIHYLVARLRDDTQTQELFHVLHRLFTS